MKLCLRQLCVILFALIILVVVLVSCQNDSGDKTIESTSDTSFDTIVTTDNKNKDELFEYKQAKDQSGYFVKKFTDKSYHGELIIPETYQGKPVIGISKAAFSYCEQVSSVVFPSSITTIEQYAFYGCNSLKSVVIPSGVQNIEPFTFAMCTDIESITIHENVSWIRESAFEGCSSLSTLTLPKNLRGIEKKGFADCTALKEIYALCENVSLQEYIFTNCPIEYARIPFGAADDVSNPFLKTVVFFGSNAIASGAFSNSPNLESITLEGNSDDYYCESNCVISLHSNGVVAGCQNSVIPNGVLSIGEHAFYGCANLKSITLPDSIQAIFASAFQGCSSLTEIEIPQGIEWINWGAFSGCSSLTRVVLPDSVRWIDRNAFYMCENLESITIPPRLEEIGIQAFEGCSKLEEFIMPDSVYMIGANAFLGCKSLKRFKISEGIMEIGPRAFSGCEGIIENENGVHYIGNLVVDADESITNASIRDGAVWIIEEAFKGCKLLSSIVVPGSVKIIGRNSFIDCESLTSVALSDGLLCISDEAFRDCKSLTSFTIPKSVEVMGVKIFYNCRNLTVYCDGGFTLEWNSDWNRSSENGVYFHPVVWGEKSD